MYSKKKYRIIIKIWKNLHKYEWTILDFIEF